MKGNFIDNLGRVYGLYTGGFLVFIILMAILEQMGVSAATIGILFVAFTIAIYALIGWLSADHAGRCLLRGRTRSPGCVQWHGHGC